MLAKKKVSETHQSEIFEAPVSSNLETSMFPDSEEHLLDIGTSFNPSCCLDSNECCECR